MSADLRDHLEFQYDLLYAKFRKSLAQLSLITNLMSEIQRRCELATSAGQRSIRYNLKLRLSVLEGQRALMFVYSGRVADELDAVDQHLTELEAEIESDSDADSDCEMIIWTS